MENGENKNLQGRREFFKEAARKALPMLGMVTVAAILPTALQSCSKSCVDVCTNACKNACRGTCVGSASRV